MAPSLPALPRYLLPRPEIPGDPALLDAFEQVYQMAVAARGGVIDYALSAPKWQFLSYITERKPILFHGSNAPDIDEFEPRKSNDAAEFGDQIAVYAASDPIWAMYFAILDRAVSMFKINAALRIANADGSQTAPCYYFAISQAAMQQGPFCSGTVYLLPADSFEQQPRQNASGFEVVSLQWRSPLPVRPLARIPVMPEDFPFLTQIRAFDDDVVQERIRRNPAGFPWADEEDDQ